MSKHTLHLAQAQLHGLVSDLLAAGTAVIAPAADGEDRVEYTRLASPAALSLDARPLSPLKGFLFPRSEPLFSYEQRGKDVTLHPVSAEFSPRVVLGALPCDAGGLAVMDAVMGWDYRDEPWFGRRAATTILSIVCPHADDSCFCSAVGLHADSPRGADLLLVPVDGGFQVQVHSDKGAAFVDQHAARFAEQPAGSAEQARAFRQRCRDRVQGNLDLDPPAMRSWIESSFAHSLWSEIALACHGCGACTMVCPTCHCFDIVDEQEGVGRGTRRRNWDGCQYELFTLHGGGHNPRPDQGARYRQRISHKFAIYPDRFDELLCTGCGRCVRDCPAGIDLLEILDRVQALAEPPTDELLRAAPGGAS